MLASIIIGAMILAAWICPTSTQLEFKGKGADMPLSQTPKDGLKCDIPFHGK